QPADSHRADRRIGGGLLSLARGDHPEADEGGGIREGDGLLSQSDLAGGGGAGSPRCARVASSMRRSNDLPQARQKRNARVTIAPVRTVLGDVHHGQAGRRDSSPTTIADYPELKDF